MKQHRLYLKSPYGIQGKKGNIVIVVAFSLTLLISVLALVIDGGFLYLTKNKIQDGVELAALAGAIHMGDGYDDDGTHPLFSIARKIGEENGIPAQALTVKIGVYDDKTHEFTEDPDPGTMINETLDPGDEEITILNNAVRVSVAREAPTFFSGIFGADTVTISAEKLAYGRRDTFIATTTDDETTGIDAAGDAIIPGAKWHDGYGQYWNTRFVSNTGVAFSDDQTETFKNATIQTGAGISGAGDGTPGLEVIDTAPDVTPKKIDWQALREKAEENGVVYTDLESWPDTWAFDEFGNGYKRGEVHELVDYGFEPYISYFFLPAGRDNTNPAGTQADGDHEGRTYYFEIPETAPPGFPRGYVLRVWQSLDDNIQPLKRTAWNFTIAAPCGFTTYPSPLASGHPNLNTTLGNFPEFGDRGLVHIYARESSGFGTNWFTQLGTQLTVPNGVVFHAEGPFHMDIRRADVTTLTTYYLRVHAGSIIIFTDRNMGRMRFDGAFGPLNNIRFGQIPSR